MIRPCAPQRHPAQRHARRRPRPGLANVGLLPAQASAAPASQSQQRDWNIPAGPLAVALDQMARQGGLNLSFDADSLKGRTTNGVRGHYDNAQALQILLHGSDVQMQQQSEQSFC
jgi:outer membrane receptor for ferric coprogen and ferric-rhodotorulic acid